MEETTVEMTMEAAASGEMLLDRLLAAVEALEQAVAKMSAMHAQAGPAEGRKTISAGFGALMAKEGSAEGSGAGLDEALSSLSVEQRIAVKAGLLRSGMIR